METFYLEKGERDLSKVVAFMSMLSKSSRWEVIVKRYQKPRSDPQNSALWGVAYKRLADFTGHDMEELHSIFMRAYFGEVEKDLFGLKCMRPRRTTTRDEFGNKDVMSITDFSNLYTFIQHKAAEIGCNVPDPDPLWFMKDDAA